MIYLSFSPRLWASAGNGTGGARARDAGVGGVGAGSAGAGGAGDGDAGAGGVGTGAAGAAGSGSGAAGGIGATTGAGTGAGTGVAASAYGTRSAFTKSSICLYTMSLSNGWSPETCSNSAVLLNLI